MVVVQVLSQTGRLPARDAVIIVMRFVFMVLICPNPCQVAMQSRNRRLQGFLNCRDEGYSTNSAADASCI